MNNEENMRLMIRQKNEQINAMQTENQHLHKIALEISDRLIAYEKRFKEDATNIITLHAENLMLAKTIRNFMDALDRLDHTSPEMNNAYRIGQRALLSAVTQRIKENSHGQP